MQTEHANALNFYDAVIANDASEVQKILNDASMNKNIPVKVITGMLVIAVEKKYVHSARAIIEHNNYTNDKILDKDLNSILCLAAKNKILREITHTSYHYV